MFKQVSANNWSSIDMYHNEMTSLDMHQNAAKNKKKLLGEDSSLYSASQNIWSVIALLH